MSGRIDPVRRRTGPDAVRGAQAVRRVTEREPEQERPDRRPPGRPPGPASSPAPADDGRPHIDATA